MKKVKPEKLPPSPTMAAAERLHFAAIHLLRRVRRQDSASGIGPAQLSAMSVLVFGGPQTLGSLAAAEQVRPPTMSRTVAALKRSRLIAITRDPRDIRRIQIRASLRGVRLLKQGRQRRIEYLASHLESLSSSELVQMEKAAESLEKLLHNWR